MSDSIRGSLEIITGAGDTATSDGLPVAAVTPDHVPLILTAVYGLTGVADAEPEPGQEAAWTATNDRQQAVRVILWREPDYDETLIGQVIAMVTEGITHAAQSVYEGEGAP